MAAKGGHSVPVADKPPRRAELPGLLRVRRPPDAQEARRCRAGPP